MCTFRDSIIQPEACYMDAPKAETSSGYFIGFQFIHDRYLFRSNTKYCSDRAQLQ